MNRRKREAASGGFKVYKPRIWELDALRGISILLVVWDHVMYDLAFIFNQFWLYSGNRNLVAAARFALSYAESDLRLYGWCVFVFIFFFVSGICTGFSKNNLLRGVKLAVVAALVTLITWLLEEKLEFEDVFIKFGVLHCLALCILLFAVLELPLNFLSKRFKGGRYVKIGVYFAVFIAVTALNSRFNVDLIDNQAHYTTVPSVNTWTGMFVYTNDWWTADYFPLLPFFCFFMLGAALSPILYHNKRSLVPRLDGAWNIPFTAAGKYSLYIYLAIQVVAIGLLYLITLIVTGIDPFF